MKNTAAKGIYDKYHRNRFKLPVWVVIAFLLMANIIVSAWVGMNAAQERLDAIIDNLPEYTETGERPQWFRDWLKQEGLE